MSDTTSTETTKPFRYLRYYHEFGDESAGYWTYGPSGTSSKNVALGGVACHVYSSAGTYTYTCTVFDGKAFKSLSTTITIESADDYYGGSPGATVCISSSSPGNFAGAPAGATLIQGSDADALLTTHFQSLNRRVLFCEDEIFTFSTVFTVGASSNGGMLGSYGPSGGRAKFRSSAAVNGWLTFDGCADVKLAGIEFDGQSNAREDRAIAIQGVTNLLLKDVYVHDIGFGIEAALNSTNDGLTLWDVTVDRIVMNHQCVFAQGRRLAIMGLVSTETEASSAEHLLRIGYADKAVVQHGFYDRSADDKETIALRVPPANQDLPLQFGSGDLRRTRYVVVSDNRIRNNQDAACAFQAGPPNDTTGDADMVEMVFTRNYVYAGGGAAGGSATVWYGDDSLEANNIYDYTGSGATAMVGSSVNGSTTWPGLPDPVSHNLDILHNSYYLGTDNTQHRFHPIRLSATTLDGGEITNNIAWAGHSGLTDCDMVNPATGNTVTVGVNSTDAQMANGQPSCFANAGGSPNEPANFAPASYALAAAGTADSSIKCWDDFNGLLRTYGNRAPRLAMGAIQG